MKKQIEWAEEKQLLGIIPANDWSAMFAERQEDGGYALESEPLVCWAQVRLSMRHVRTGEIARDSAEIDAVMGIGQCADLGTHYAEDDAGFLGYLHKSQPLEKWQWALDEYAAKHQEPTT